MKRSILSFFVTAICLFPISNYLLQAQQGNKFIKRLKNILKKIILVLIFLFMGAFTLFAQTPVIQWQKCLGGSGDESMLSVNETSDGGYILSGYTTSNDGDVSGNHGGYDIWVVKLNSNRDIQWQKCLGGSGNDIGFCQETSDGGYVVVGYTSSNDGDVSGNHGNNDYWVVKLNSNGVIQWQKCYGGSDLEYAESIQETSDGGYIIAGYTHSNDGDVSGNHGNWDYWIVKINNIGTLQWQKCLGGTSHDYANSIQKTDDGGYIIAGYTQSDDGDVSGFHGGADYWIVKINSSGVIQWQKCLGGSSNDYAECIRVTRDGGYIITGEALSNDGDVTGNHGITDYWVVKLTSSGAIQWQKCLGGTNYEYSYFVQETNDDGFIIAGHTASNNGDVIGNHGQYDVWVVKLNNIGTIQWQKCFGGSGNDEVGNMLVMSSDSGYIISGSTTSNDGDVSGNHGGYDFWIMKITLNSIDIGSISPSSYCQGATINIPYTVVGPFNSGNIFTAQLSNSSGDFSSPTVIGSLTSTSSGIISCTIPANTPPGNGYRIRIVSSDPAMTGDNNGSNIIINPLPTPSIIGSSTVCAHNTYPYTCTPPGGTTCLWKAINGTIDGPATNNIVDIEWDSQSSGTVTLIQTTSSGCVDSTFSEVTINPLPQPVISTSDTILCAGKIGVYNSNNVAGLLYQWNISGGIIQGASDTPSLIVLWNNAGSGTVTLIQTYANTGCKDSTKKNVTINPLPKPQITTSDTNICINTIGLYSSNTGANLSYLWLATGGTIQSANNNSSINVLWDNAGSKIIRLVQTNSQTGCIDSTEKTVNVNPFPNTQITGNANVLLNSTVQYTASTPAGITNQWSVTNGTYLGSTTDSIFIVKWDKLSLSIVMLEQTNTNTGCMNFDTLDITVFASIPPLVVNAGSDVAICNGSSIKIGNANPASGGIPPYRYKWTPSQGLSNDTIPMPTAIPDNTTLYILTVTDSRDSTANDTVNVIVNPEPVPQISGEQAVLLNSIETYSAITPSGTANLWSVNNGTQIGSNTGNTYQVKWDMIGTGSVILEQTITATGCKALDTLSINVTISIPGLTVEAGVNKDICMNDSTQLASANPASGGSQPYRYLWTPSQGLSNDTIPNPMGSPLKSTKYMLTVTDSKDSTAQDSVIITVNPLPEALVKGNRNVMLNSTVTYSADTPPGITNFWSVENGTQIGTNNNDSFQVRWDNVGKGKVILNQTITATGCQEANTIDINISSTIPPLIADAGLDKEVCSGDTVQIGSINAASGGAEPYTYKWLPSNGLNNDTIPNPKACPLNTTVYTITIIDAQDSVATDNVTVTVNPLPMPLISGNNKVMRGTIVNYSVNIQTSSTNLWSVENGTQIGSGKGTTFQVRWDSAGTGKVIVEQTITATGCKGTDTMLVIVDAKQYAAILDLPDIEGETGQIINLPVYLRDAEMLNNTNVTGFNADLKYNSSLLEPVQTTPRGTLSTDGKERIIPLRLGVNPISDSTLEYLSFKAMLGNDTMTTLSLENVSSIGADVNIGTLNGTFRLKGVCFEGGARLIGPGPAASIVINPNPVSNSCKIEYETYSGKAKLYIVNSFGQKVKTLVNGGVSAGWHTEYFDLDKVSSGVYFVILQNETKRKTVRMDVVK